MAFEKGEWAVVDADEKHHGIAKAMSSDALAER